MKYKVGDKIKYLDFLIERWPELDGVFTVDKTEECDHGCNVIGAYNAVSAPGLPRAANRKPDDMISSSLFCSADLAVD